MTRAEYDAGPQRDAQQGDRLRAARIGKPHGIKGEVTVQLFTDEPAYRLAPGAVLDREPGPQSRNQDTAALTVCSQRWNKQICLLGFEEITDRNAAEALRGSILFVNATQAPAEQDEWYSHELEGMRCLDSSGAELGKVTELLTGPAQDLLVVQTSAGEEVMVPFVEELVPEIDADAATIHLNPPTGLFP